MGEEFTIKTTYTITIYHCNTYNIQPQYIQTIEKQATNPLEMIFYQLKTLYITLLLSKHVLHKFRINENSLSTPMGCIIHFGDLPQGGGGDQG